MADERMKEPAAVWYTHVGRQVWRAYGRHPQTLRALDVADEHVAADAVMRDLDRLAVLDAALDGVGATADELRAALDRARKATESAAIARANAEEAERECNKAIEEARVAKRKCAVAVESEKETVELHGALCDANDRPSLRRLAMALGWGGNQSYTSWLGLVK